MADYPMSDMVYPYYTQIGEPTANQYPEYGMGADWLSTWNSEMETTMEPNQSTWLPESVYEPQPILADQQTSQQSTLTYSTPQTASQATFATPTTTSYYSTPKAGLQHNPVTPNRSPVGQVPTIITQFASRSNTIEDNETENFPVMPCPDPMATLSADWMKSDTNFNADVMSDPGTGISPMNMSTPLSAPSNLQAAFQWQSPITRRTSMSSNASGPMFSPYGTPMTGSYHGSMTGTPHSLTGPWTPRSIASNTLSSASPQSPHHHAYNKLGRYNQSWTRMQNQYLPQKQRVSSTQSAWRSLPSRAKPPLEHACSDSSIPNKPAFAYSSYARPSHGRRRAVSAAAHRRGEPLGTNQNSQQLDLPQYQLGALFVTPSPELTQSGFTSSFGEPLAQPVSRQASIHTAFQNPYVIYANRDADSTNNSQENVPPPPESDFEDGLHRPVPQQPQFEGDIYTPLWKRRDKNGNWEGWCHLCTPGVWLSMKTSRYWDDKKRNHGICANTRRKFPDPLDTRVIDLQGRVIEAQNENFETSDVDEDMCGETSLISDVDGSLRKRQGLCGKCEKWVPLDGPRTKVKGKMVGWWLHCYDCLTQSKKS